MNLVPYMNGKHDKFMRNSLKVPKGTHHLLPTPKIIHVCEKDVLLRARVTLLKLESKCRKYCNTLFSGCRQTDGWKFLKVHRQTCWDILKSTQTNLLEYS